MHVSPTMWWYYLRQYFRQRQVLLLVRFGVFVLFVAAYSVLFHVFMAREGHTYSWVTGLYWTITVMTTLGLGDVTFTSDVGRVFTLMVILSGVVFLLSCSRWCSCEANPRRGCYANSLKTRGGM